MINIIKKIISILFVILCLFLSICVIEPTQLDVNHITVKSNQIPPEFNGTTIEVMADFHYGTYVDENRLKEVVNKANKQNPDIIVLAGDYVTDDKTQIEPCFNILKNLNAPMGIYAVLGNNDPHNETIQAINNARIMDINNNGTWIEKNGAKIKLGGVGDLSTDLHYPRRTTGDINDSSFVILVYHNPNYFSQLNHSKIDLSISGHTHGGQINLFGYAPMVQAADNGKQYISGLFEEDNANLIVTNGIGEVKVPFRFMATPQITIITLESC